MGRYICKGHLLCALSLGDPFTKSTTVLSSSGRSTMILSSSFLARTAEPGSQERRANVIERLNADYFKPGSRQRRTVPNLAPPTTSPIILTMVFASFAAATRPCMHSIAYVSPLSASSSCATYSMSPRLAVYLLAHSSPVCYLWLAWWSPPRVFICELQGDNWTPAGRFFHSL